MKYYNYTVDKKNRILKGFCPTECDNEEQATKRTLELCRDLIKYNIKFHKIHSIKKEE